METPYAVRLGELTGTATFRMTDADEFATDPSGARVGAAADGRALSLAYWWTHPEDQRRHEGMLLLGVPDQDGQVAAAWIDAWHEPRIVTLTGRPTAAGALVRYEYAPAWWWEVELVVADGISCLLMRNVVPEGDERPAGAYDVSRTDWS
jgi:hypothetical protein